MRYLRMMESAGISQTAATARKAAIAATEGIADRCKEVFYELFDISKKEEFFMGSVQVGDATGDKLLYIGDGIESWENCAKNGRLDEFQRAIDRGEKVKYVFFYNVEINPYRLSLVRKEGEVSEYESAFTYSKEKKEEILNMIRAAAGRIEDMGGVLELGFVSNYSKPRSSSHLQMPKRITILSNTPEFEKWLKFDPFNSATNNYIHRIGVQFPIELNLGMEQKWKSLPGSIISDFEEFCAKMKLSSSSMNELSDIIQKAMSDQPSKEDIR